MSRRPSALSSAYWTRGRGSWLRLFAIGSALATVGVVTMLDAWQDIWHIADNDPEASQVYLAPVVAAWLFWVRRERMRTCAVSSTWVGPLLILAGFGLYSFGDHHQLQSLWHLGAVIVAVGCFTAVLGAGLMTRFLPALGALVFLVPIPGRIRQAIAVPLQSVTAEITQAVLDTIGIAVERTGSVLIINQQEVLIAEACNGLRMVFALMIVSYAFAYGVPLRNGIRALVVVISPLTAIVFNVLRLTPVVWGFGQFSPELASTLHDLSAWVMLPCSFAALLGMMRALKWAQVPISPYVLAYGN